ncbi:MAG TPA: NAD-dependent epimerase/dehydratase family protein [Streptosporangiaceae bacterium]
MRVVVVGATGNVGTSTVQALAADPRVSSILGLARRRPEWQPDKTEWAQADMSRDDLAPLLRGADAVVLLAWLFQPTRKPWVTWQVNVVGSARVLRAAADAGVPALVYSSSVGAYSPGPKDRAVDETWPTHSWPTAAYGREKAYVERLLDSFQADHPDTRVVRIRPAFIFKEEAAAEQRRLFAGPLLPGRVALPRLIPVVPDMPGLRFQAVHAADVAEAFRLAVLSEVKGPFNIAADPVIDASELGRILGARPVRTPVAALRTAVAVGWHLRVVPADPKLLDLLLRLPLMDTSRARAELGWSPRHSSTDAIRAFLGGLRHNAGMQTPPLAPGAGGPQRLRKLLSGVGGRP